ncbi:MAG: hypothetical protein MUC29_06710, partial [Pyrinomonadaceae bacterium]|nr:hypothetical protein [Pyrinomonadaceae bacterium]
MKNIYKIISLVLLSVLVLGVFACQNKNETSNTNSAPTTASPATTPSMEIATQRAKSPTEAYKFLYEAVKAKNTEAIKSMMTKATIGFAEGQAQMQKVDVAKVFANGFTATTFSDTLPEIRDERIKDNMAALEVKNVKENKWEDLPFILEDGGWKLAVGETFAGSYKSPGAGQAYREREAANTATGNNMIKI